MSIISASAIESSLGYQISRSVRLRSSASAYFNRTPASASNQKTWTWSGWVKRGALGTNQVFFNAGNNGFVVRLNETTNYLEVYNYSGAYQLQLVTSQVFRDPSAWYHIVVVLDTTQATSSNRAKVYVNGSQVTSFGTATYPSQNADLLVNGVNTHAIGVLISVGQYFDGYLTEINFIDGQALTPSSFGQNNPITGVWEPMAYTGTYGTNGFYLNFSDPSAATAAAIGRDSSGNGNNWTPNNISVTAGATYDSMIDVPTPYADGGNGRGNYAVLNAVYKSAIQPTISNGNLTVAPVATANFQNAFSTIGVTTGKWYCEVLVTGTPNSANMIGVSNQTQVNYFVNNATVIGDGSGTGYGYYIYNGNKYSAGSSTSYGNSIASGDVVGIALDLDNGKIWFSKNGTWQASGDPTAGTNAAFTSIASDVWSFGATSFSSGATQFAFNFGQRPFAYTPPTGFKALNTQNLPEPTIKKGGEYFNPVLWTGNNTSGRSITGVGFQPDLVWTKARSVGYDALITDAVRGAGKSLTPSSTAAEVTNNVNGYVSALNADGFTLTQGSSSIVSVNESGQTYVGWNWKAGGTPAVTNTAGSITSTVSAGVTQGFSVVTFTGTLSAATVGHGLGVAPSFIIAKRRNGVQNWVVGSTALGWTKALNLDLTDAAATTSTAWNNTAPTSSVFSVSTFFTANTFVAYCFAEVPGFSRFGSYTGNGSADGPFVFCGFRPRYLMIKRSNTTGNWALLDTSRSTFNVVSANLYANLSDAESSSARLDILSNGFKLRTTGGDFNGTSGDTYIFAAFAENPFKYALAR